MRNLLAKRQFSQPMSYAYLCFIWHVDADNTYHIVKRQGAKHPYESDYIAVRTINGCGILMENNGKRHEMKENSLGIFRSADIARYDACEEGWHFYGFRFNQGDWKEKFNWVADLSINMSELKDMEHCFVYLNSGLERECLNAEALFNYLLSDWFMRLNAVGQNNISLREIINLLEKGADQKLGIAELAKEAGMCERSFRSTVHRVTGMSPKDYINKRKMETAMELLQTTARSVSEISADLHYDTPFYFSRAFKRHFGISPKQARDVF